MEEESSKQNVPFTNEEIEKIRYLLNASPEGSDKLAGMHINFNKTWLIDSGASHHMTGRRDYLKHIWVGEQYFVSLPDGRRRVKANEHGEVILSETFTLKDVLYVPSLTCDLISDKQLISESNCVVTFFSDYCVMQDQVTRTEIGRG